MCGRIELRMDYAPVSVVLLNIDDTYHMYLSVCMMVCAIDMPDRCNKKEAHAMQRNAWMALSKLDGLIHQTTQVA